MFESSNLKNLSSLIEEKKEIYTFRKLQKHDAPAAHKLMNTTFLSHNPVMKLLQVNLEDIQVLQALEIFNQIIQEDLSFGAFHGEELVSACLTCDFKTNLIQKGIKPTETAQFIINLIDQLFQEFIQKQEINKKQVVYLNHLGTNKDYLRQNLATACAYLSIAECQNYGYEQVITDSWHQGTFGTYEKMFKLFEVIKEINQLNEQPVHIKSLIAQITPQKPFKRRASQ